MKYLITASVEVAKLIEANSEEEALEKSGTKPWIYSRRLNNIQVNLKEIDAKCEETIN